MKTDKNKFLLLPEHIDTQTGFVIQNDETQPFLQEVGRLDRLNNPGRYEKEQSHRIKDEQRIIDETDNLFIEYLERERKGKPYAYEKEFWKGFEKALLSASFSNDEKKICRTRDYENGILVGRAEEKKRTTLILLDMFGFSTKKLAEIMEVDEQYIEDLTEFASMERVVFGDDKAVKLTEMTNKSRTNYEQ